jgi:hypothetical protein
MTAHISEEWVPNAEADFKLRGILVAISEAVFSILRHLN